MLGQGFNLSHDYFVSLLIPGLWGETILYLHNESRFFPRAQTMSSIFYLDTSPMDGITD